MILLIVLLLVLCLVGLPQVGGGWHHSGYAPSSVLGILLVVVVVLVLLGRI
jgi:hypothetical protein